MAIKFDGSTDALSNTSDYLSGGAYPMSFTGYFRPNSATGQHTLFAYVDSISGHYHQVYQDGLAAKAATRGKSGFRTVTREALAAVALTNGQWHRVSATFTSATDRQIFVTNLETGVKKTGANTSSCTPDSLDWMSVGGQITAATPTFSRYLDGDLAELAWSNISGLFEVRHDSLVYYENLLIQPRQWDVRLPLFNVAAGYNVNLKDEKTFDVAGTPANATAVPIHPSYQMKRALRRTVVPVFPTVAGATLPWPASRGVLQE